MVSAVQSMSEELGNVTEDSRITSEENLSRNFYISENTVSFQD